MKEILGPRGPLGLIVVSLITPISPRPRESLGLIVVSSITSISSRLLGPS